MTVTALLRMYACKISRIRLQEYKNTSHRQYSTVNTVRPAYGLDILRFESQ